MVRGGRAGAKFAYMLAFSQPAGEVIEPVTPNAAGCGVGGDHRVEGGVVPEGGIHSDDEEQVGRGPDGGPDQGSVGGRRRSRRRRRRSRRSLFVGAVEPEEEPRRGRPGGRVMVSGWRDAMTESTGPGGPVWLRVTRRPVAVQHGHPRGTAARAVASVSRSKVSSMVRGAEARSASIVSSRRCGPP